MVRNPWRRSTIKFGKYSRTVFLRLWRNRKPAIENRKCKDGLFTHCCAPLFATGPRTESARARLFDFWIARQRETRARRRIGQSRERNRDGRRLLFQGAGNFRRRARIEISTHRD